MHEHGVYGMIEHPGAQELSKKAGHSHPLRTKTINNTKAMAAITG